MDHAALLRDECILRTAILIDYFNQLKQKNFGSVVIFLEIYPVTVCQKYKNVSARIFIRVHKTRCFSICVKILFGRARVSRFSNGRRMAVDSYRGPHISP